MSKNLYVGNLSYDTSSSQLQALFEEYGTVTAVNVITDRDTGRPRGFAFVEMEDEDAANAAIEGLNGKELDGRALTVNEARPRPARSGGGNRGGRQGGGDRRGGGDRGGSDRGGGDRRRW
jgi:cold-inducible RNA-binding protein